MRLPALIFDFGNVVAFFDYRKAADRLGARLGIPGDTLLDQARAVGFSRLVRDYESGTLSAESFSAAVGRMIGLDLTRDEFAEAWSDIFWLNEPVVRLVAGLKSAGFTLVLGSNTNDLHSRHFRRRFAQALAPFDHLVLSHEIGHVKPSPAFYLACARAAGAPPASCLFIDDLPENVAGARDAGLRGLIYRDTPTLLAELRGMGIEVPKSEIGPRSSHLLAGSDPPPH